MANLTVWLRRLLAVSAGIGVVSGLILVVRSRAEERRLAPYAWLVDARVVQALLSEDWKSMEQQLNAVSPGSPSIEQRMLKGHACLALNRNNESLALFRSVSSAEESRQWDNWTSWLLGAHSNSAQAYYLRGDAQARRNAWPEAMSSFSQALELHPGHPLFLNARGVTNAARNEFDPALLDLEEATQKEGPTADIFCSRGTLYLQGMHNLEGARSAFADFNRALKLSPDFVPALIGRGCAQFVLGNRAMAYQDFRRADTGSGWLHEMCRQNIAAAIAFVGGDKKLAFLPPDKLGMEVERRLSAFASNPNSQTVKEVGDALAAAKALGGDAAINKASSELAILKNMHPTNASKMDQLVADEFKTALKDSKGSWLPKDVHVGVKGIEVGVGGLGIGDVKTRQAQEKQDVWGNVIKSAPKSTANSDPYYGGAWLGLDKSKIDDGRWPSFRSVYGLLYHTNEGAVIEAARKDSR
jgi:tetratricopeptide (TPR) repeat protein